MTMIAVGRCLLASLFVLGGINKLINWSATAERMTEVGLEPAALLLALVVALELVGGVLVMWGRRWLMLAALALATFTLATNIIFHAFWTLGDDPQMQALELSLFFKNISIAGALVMVAGLAEKSSAQ